LTLHIHRVPTRVVSVSLDGEVRWCFVCRKRVAFTRTIHTPTDPMSYYGPHASIECERGHSDGDVFPGYVRECEEPE
jgi:hypothetical protein